MGSSSWYFPGWESIVWGEKVTDKRVRAMGLSAYGQHPLLRTVGVDRSYHGPVRADVWKSYAAQVPEDFRFWAKAPRYVLTPWQKGGGENPRFLELEFLPNTLIRWLKEGAGDKAEGLIVQFTPQESGYLFNNWERLAPRLREFLSVASAELELALELRHKAAAEPRVHELLAEANAVPCIHVHPSSPSIREQQSVARAFDFPRFVCRWNLQPPMRYEDARSRHRPFDRLVDPDPERRSEIAACCAEALEAGGEATVIINNKAEGSAPLSVFALAEEIAPRL